MWRAPRTDNASLLHNRVYGSSARFRPNARIVSGCVKTVCAIGRESMGRFILTWLLTGMHHGRLLAGCDIVGMDALQLVGGACIMNSRAAAPLNIWRCRYWTIINGHWRIGSRADRHHSVHGVSYFIFR